MRSDLLIVALLTSSTAIAQSSLEGQWTHTEFNGTYLYRNVDDERKPCVLTWFQTRIYNLKETPGTLFGAYANRTFGLWGPLSLQGCRIEGVEGFVPVPFALRQWNVAGKGGIVGWRDMRGSFYNISANIGPTPALDKEQFVTRLTRDGNVLLDFQDNPAKNPLKETLTFFPGDGPPIPQEAESLLRQAIVGLHGGDCLRTLEESFNYSAQPKSRWDAICDLYRTKRRLTGGVVSIRIDSKLRIDRWRIADAKSALERDWKLNLETGAYFFYTVAFEKTTLPGSALLVKERDKQWKILVSN
jgi:hypothetical protein